MAPLNYEVFKRLNPGEKSLVEWKLGTASHFTTALWELMCRADEANLHRIELGFPQYVEACRNYKRRAGWWPGLAERLGVPD